jgi:RNA polymerase sigma factor (sigma-70 family)
MHNRAAKTLRRYLHTLIAGHNAEGTSDQVLLEQFVSRRDEGAFAALLERHGSMVFGVCWRILHDEHLAEDAFQATFLVLARKASSICKQHSIASWLHGVALRVARKANAEAMHLKQPDARNTGALAPDPQAEVSWHEMQEILDEELEQLPDRYRLPLVLCYLEGRTRDEAAVQLGWTQGKLKGLLERGRDRLRSRLIRRGVTPSAAVSASLLAGTSSSAMVPPNLTVSTVEAAVRFAAGNTLTACGISATAASLTEGCLTIMSLTRIKTPITITLLLLGTLALGYGVLASSHPDSKAGGGVGPVAPKEEKAEPRPAGFANGKKQQKKIIVREIDIEGYRRLVERDLEGIVSKPTKITSLEELTKAFPEAEWQKKIAKQVDYSKEYLLFFTWSDLPGHKLSFKVEQSKTGPVAVFQFPLTKIDESSFAVAYLHLFAVSKEASWRFENAP